MSGAQQMFPHPKSTVLCYWLHNRLRLFGSVLMANTNFLLHVSPKHFFSLDILLYLQLNGNRHATWPIRAVHRKNKHKRKPKTWGNRLSSQHLELRLDFSIKELISFSEGGFCHLTHQLIQKGGCPCMSALLPLTSYQYVRQKQLLSF